MKIMCWYIHMRAGQMETFKVQRGRGGERNEKREKGND